MSFAQLLGKLEFDRVTPIPMCARDGDNVTTASARMPWYRGVSLLKALEAADLASARPGPFRMPVQYVSRPDHTFRGYAGTVASGRVHPGDLLTNVAAHTEAAVTRIVTMDGDLKVACTGDPITLVLDRDIDISRADVLAAGSTPVAADGLDSWVVWMDDNFLSSGDVRTYCVSAPVAVVATVTEITTRLEMETLEEASVRELALNEIGRVSISLNHPVVCEPLQA